MGAGELGFVEAMAGEEIDPRVRKDFEATVKRALEDKETKATLDDLPKRGLNVSVTKVRADLLAQPKMVLDRTRTMQEGWERARERRNEMLRETARQTWAAFSWKLFLVAAGLAALGFVLLPPAIHWWSLLAFVLPLSSPYLRAVGLISLFPVRTADLARRRFLVSLEAQVTVAVREVANQLLTSFLTTFDIFDRRGLRQLADPDREVSAKAATELDGLLASLDSGSVGLAGPRGCGKTTLIRNFTEGRSMPFNKERIGLNVAAPVRYDPREFILHLFASLCEEVLINRPRALAQAGTRVPGVRDLRLLWVLGLGALALGAAGAVILLDVQAPSQHTIGIALSIASGLLGITWFMMWFGQSQVGRTLGRSLAFSVVAPVFGESMTYYPEGAAKAYLKQIRFQQSQEAGGSTELSLPLGLGLGGSSATTLSRTPWTLPEAVEEFRRFAATLSQRFVVIGIDELDKMESDAAAREFLNNVKGVFGVEGCYFLVSVSEDAMSAFERRGLPLRDVFDSSFDEIQRIGYLDLAESRGVLESRVTGVPVPFQCLCHCLAGGLPRDLIRTTRELVYHYDAEQARGEAANASLGNLARLLVRTEWRGKVTGAIAAGRSAAAHPWWLTTWLHEMDQGDPDSSSLRAWTTQLSRDPAAAWRDPGEDGMAEARRVAMEMMAFNYYAATLLEFFSDQGLASRIEDPAEHGELDEGAVAKLETLAMARQQFAVDPRLAWKLVEQARDAEGLGPW